MSRPRFAVLLSAVVASIAAFAILKRWELIGTLSGAALFPLLYTLFSYGSHRGIDRTLTALRRRSGRGQAAPGEEQPSSPNRLIGSDPPPKQPSIPEWTRWLSVGLACAALGVGVYTMFLGSSTERVIVRERVIEREAASAVQPTAVSDDPDAPRPKTDPTTTTSTSSTTTTSEEDAPSTDSSPTATNGPADTVNPGETSDSVTPPNPENGAVSTASTADNQGGSQTTTPSTQTTP